MKSGSKDGRRHADGGGADSIAEVDDGPLPKLKAGARDCPFPEHGKWNVEAKAEKQ